MDQARKEQLVKWVRAIISAIVGAAISFGVTWGVISEQGIRELYSSIVNINDKTELLIEALQSKDVDNALAIAKEIAQDTKVIIDTSKEALSNIR